MAANDLLTPTAAGRLFEPPLTAERIRQLVDTGVLRAVRTANGWRLIKRSSVERLIRERMGEAESK